eukprot:567898-Hanusia_phi.AAC.1
MVAKVGFRPRWSIVDTFLSHAVTPPGHGGGVPGWQCQAAPAAGPPRDGPGPADRLRYNQSTCPLQVVNPGERPGTRLQRGSSEFPNPTRGVGSGN